MVAAGRRARGGSSTRGRAGRDRGARAPPRGGVGGRAPGSRGRGGAERIVLGFGRRQRAGTRTRSRGKRKGRRWRRRRQPGGSKPREPERAATAAWSAQRGQPALAAHQRAHAKGCAVPSARRAAGGAQALPAPSVRTPAAPPALPLPPSTRGPRPAPGGPRVLLPRQRCPRRPERAGPGQRAGGWRCWTWPRREWPCSASCSSWCCG